MAAPVGHGEAHHLVLSGEDIVVCVDQVDLHLVWAGRQTEDVDGIAVAVSAHNHGKSSTVMCKCPTRGDTLSAPWLSTGPMRTFSVRYWIQTRPLGKAFGKRWIHNWFRRGLIFDFDVGRGTTLPCGLGRGACCQGGRGCGPRKCFDESAHRLSPSLSWESCHACPTVENAGALPTGGPG